MSRLARDPSVEALLAAYRGDLEASGKFAGNPMISPARSFLLRVGVGGWSALSLSEQRSISEHESRLVTWLIVTGRLRPTPEYLVASRLRAGRVAAWAHREFHERFIATAAGLGFATKSAELQWWAVALVAALVGVRPERLTKAQFDAAREQLIATSVRLDPEHPGRAGILSTRLYGGETTLFHAGVIDVAPRKRCANKSADRASEWASVPPRLAATLQGYVEQMRLSLQPGSMFHIERVLRQFALWLTGAGGRGRSGCRSPSRAYRALQTSPPRAPERARPALQQAHARRRPGHATDLPRAPLRVARRGRSRARADVPRRRAAPG